MCGAAPFPLGLDIASSLSVPHRTVSNLSTHVSILHRLRSFSLVWNMAFTNNYTGTSLHQQEQPQDQDKSQSPHQSTFQDSYLRPKVIQWKSPTHSHESRTQGTSTLLVSPMLDIVNETASTINEGYSTPLRTNELSLSSFYRYAYYGHSHHKQSSYLNSDLISHDRELSWSRAV